MADRRDEVPANTLSLEDGKMGSERSKIREGRVGPDGRELKLISFSSPIGSNPDARLTHSAPVGSTDIPVLSLASLRLAAGLSLLVFALVWG